MKNLITSAFIFCSFFSAQSQVIESDSLALVAFYHATGGAGWTDQTNWLSNAPVSEWFGIYIEAQRVSEISIYDNNLTGSFPAIIGNLTGLERIYLPSNLLSGEIPPEIGQCTELTTIDFSVNELTGDFPQEILNCQKLEAITLYRNQFSGAFPDILLNLPELWRLELGDNDYSGELPVALNDATKLRLLGLDRNEFSGQMVSLKKLTAMVELHLDGNNLHGDIADIFSYSPNMYYLTLGGNHFTGCVSDTFFNPQKLQFLDFPNNNFDCVGDFSAFADTGVLKRLYLYGNKIPFEFLETNSTVSNYAYNPQQLLLDVDTLLLSNGDSIEIESGSQGLYTHYVWFRNGAEIAGETNSTLWVKDFDATKTGYYFSNMTNDSLPLLTLQRSKITLNLDAGTATRELQPVALNIFPNPVSQYIQIPPDFDHGKAYIYDGLGRVVGINEFLESGQLNVAHLPSGIYFLIVRTDDQVANGRFFKSYAR